MHACMHAYISLSSLFSLSLSLSLASLSLFSISRARARSLSGTRALSLALSSLVLAHALSRSCALSRRAQEFRVT